jgi:hypothetical protein
MVGERWEGSMQEVFLGLRDWRALHPKATFTEIEAEVDRRVSQLRAQLLTDLALASSAARLASAERPVCPGCGGRLHDEGARERTLMTAGHAPVTLRRDYATCTRCGQRLFPPGR